MNKSSLASAERASYRTLWLILAIALLPLLASMVMYFGRLAVPEGRVNHGALVIDQPPLSTWHLRHHDGAEWRDGEGKWLLMQVAESCDAQCQSWRRTLVQLHKALGRERDRVLPLVVGSDVTDTELPQLMRAVGEDTPVPEVGIWLADPLGNLVLYYRFDQSPRDILDDLKRLLKVSKVG